MSIGSKRMFGLIFILILFFMSAAEADVFIRQKLHSDAVTIMGQNQPAKDEIQSTWIARNKIRSDTETSSVLMLLDKNKMYFLDHGKKTVSEMDLSFGDMSGQFENEEEARQFQKMMGNMFNVEITVTKTGEKKKIGQWQCTRYIQKMESMMGPSTTEIWASEAITVDADVYAKFAASKFAMNPAFKNAMEKIGREMKKVKGVTVRSESTISMMGQTMKSSTELQEIKEGKAPKGFFELPKGYKKTKMESPMM